MQFYPHTQTNTPANDSQEMYFCKTLLCLDNKMALVTILLFTSSLQYSFTLFALFVFICCILNYFSNDGLSIFCDYGRHL